MSQRQIARCCAHKIKTALITAAHHSSWLLLTRPVDPQMAGSLRFQAASLWRLELWREPGSGLTCTLEAIAPDGRCWQRGCQRDWLGSGEVIDPLDALLSSQRQALDQRLLAAMAWPNPTDPEAWPLPSIAQLEHVPARTRRRP